ncbi:MAG TPA: hypothetical protein VIQ23_14635 [Hanamia sp.]|jgi:Nucleoside H+ symporter.
MPLFIRIRLSVLMFLQYFIWGTYILSNLKGSAIQVGAAYANLSILAGVVMIFFALIFKEKLSHKKTV